MVSSPINRKAVALLVLVFALGAGLGVVSTVLVNQRVFGARLQQQGRGPGPGSPGGPGAMQQVHLPARLTQELNLTADQQKQIGDILASMQKDYDGLREQMNPQFVQVREQGRERIRQVLTPEQKPQFDDFLRRVDEERKKRQAQTQTR